MIYKFNQLTSGFFIRLNLIDKWQCIRFKIMQISGRGLRRQIVSAPHAGGIAERCGGDMYMRKAGHDEPAFFLLDLLHDQRLGHDAASEKDAGGIVNVGQCCESQHDFVHPLVNDAPDRIVLERIKYFSACVELRAV